MIYNTDPRANVKYWKKHSIFMEQKNIVEYEKRYDIKPHPSVKGLKIIEGKSNFPISWLNKQGYCEYQIYLEHVKGMEVEPTRAMSHGSEIHKQLEDAFRQDATPASFEDAVEASKSEALMSREVFVVSETYGIMGYIDEIWMKPDEIVIIDDKPGRTPYESTMNQVRAYCLAYRDMTGDERKIRGALRERGTDNLFWIEVFEPDVEKQIIFKINRMHGLLDGSRPFTATKNPNKCRSCRFKDECEHAR